MKTRGKFQAGVFLVGWMMLMGIVLQDAKVLGAMNLARNGQAMEITVTAPRDLHEREPSPLSPQPKRSRASAAHIGAIMALLATFDEAGVLPPEDSPLATQLIHGLIQLQSAFMKSSDPALRRFFTEAMRSYFFEQAEAAESDFRQQGWTSRTLEAVLLYQSYPHVWKTPELDQALKVFHVARRDLKEILIVFNQARMALLTRHQDIHDAYERRRREMPGA